MQRRNLLLIAFVFGVIAPLLSYGISALTAGRYGLDAVALAMLVAVPVLTARAFRRGAKALDVVTAAFPGFFVGGLLAYGLWEMAGNTAIGGLGASLRLAEASLLAIISAGLFTVTWVVLKTRARRTQGPAA